MPLSTNILPVHNKDSNSDCYETPTHCWDLIKKYIPENKIIWEPFYLNGSSGDYLTNLGFEVIHLQEDFFMENKGDIVVSNPPWSKNKNILKKLKELDKPFILLVPINVIATNYFRKIFNDDLDNITIFLFDKRVSFRPAENVKASSNFSVSIFLGYKVNDKNIIYL